MVYARLLLLILVTQQIQHLKLVIKKRHTVSQRALALVYLDECINKLLE
jgi:hypothetical protein